MDTRRAVIQAISDLRPDQRAQLLLYLLGDDFAALDVIDGGKWRFQEYKPWPSGKELDRLLAEPRDSPAVPEGEGLQ